MIHCKSFLIFYDKVLQVSKLGATLILLRAGFSLNILFLKFISGT